MKKIVVYVPVTHTDKVREAIGQAGGGKLGNYSSCSFSTRGLGRFKPEVGANPHMLAKLAMYSSFSKSPSIYCLSVNRLKLASR